LAQLLEEARLAVPPHAALLLVTEIGTSDEGVYLASPVLNAPSVEGRLLALDAQRFVDPLRRGDHTRPFHDERTRSRAAPRLPQ
jgi:hypothetical protein